MFFAFGKRKTQYKKIKFFGFFEKFGAKNQNFCSKKCPNGHFFGNFLNFETLFANCGMNVFVRREHC